MFASGKTCRGFTLVEMLVVIAVIGILMAIALPALQAAREAAHRAQCANNLKQLGLAMLSYESKLGVLPMNWGEKGTGSDTKGHSWLTAMLPYIESAPLYNEIKTGEKLGYTDTNSKPSKDNKAAAKTVVPAFICPSDLNRGTMVMQTVQGFLQGEPVGATNYKACLGSDWEEDVLNPGKKVTSSVGRNANEPDTSKNHDARDYCNGIMCRGYWEGSGKPVRFLTTMAEIRDGASNTIAIGEAVPQWCEYSAWYWWDGATATCAIPLNYQYPSKRREENADDWKHNYSFMSRHPGGANFCMVDGSARFVSQLIADNVYRALGTIQAEEMVDQSALSP